MAQKLTPQIIEESLSGEIIVTLHENKSLNVTFTNISSKGDIEVHLDCNTYDSDNARFAEILCEAQYPSVKVASVSYRETQLSNDDLSIPLTKIAL